MGDHGKHSFECPMPIIQNPGAKNKFRGPEPRGIFLEVLGVNLTSTAAVRLRAI